ncbi:hypothetical protein BH11ARM2_BH11ARM2_02370 [soil metagenome]
MTVEWTFAPHGDEATFVKIASWEFTSSDEEKTEQAILSTEGFALVLANLKGLMEEDAPLSREERYVDREHIRTKSQENVSFPGICG